MRSNLIRLVRSLDLTKEELALWTERSKRYDERIRARQAKRVPFAKKVD